MFDEKKLGCVLDGIEELFLEHDMTNCEVWYVVGYLVRKWMKGLV